MMMKDVLGRLESVLDTHNISLGTLVVPFQTIGSLHDPNGCLSRFATEDSYKGYWDVVRFTMGVADSLWLVQREHGDGYSYLLPQGFVPVLTYLYDSGKDVTVRRAQLDATDPERWWIVCSDLPDDRGMALDYKVYATIEDSDGFLNDRSLTLQLGKRQAYTPGSPKEWDIVFTGGRFWLRKRGDRTANFVLYDLTGGCVNLIRAIKHPRLIVDAFTPTDRGKGFRMQISLSTGGTQVIGDWYAEYVG